MWIKDATFLRVVRIKDVQIWDMQELDRVVLIMHVVAISLLSSLTFVSWKCIDRL